MKLKITVKHFHADVYEFVELGYLIGKNTCRYTDIEMFLEDAEPDHILKRREFIRFKREYKEFLKNYK